MTQKIQYFYYIQHFKPVSYFTPVLSFIPQHVLEQITEAHSKPSRASKIGLLTIFAKSSILDVRLSSKYASVLPSIKRK